MLTLLSFATHVQDKTNQLCDGISQEVSLQEPVFQYPYLFLIFFVADIKHVSSVTLSLAHI
jgi:hypothetical protein